MSAIGTSLNPQPPSYRLAVVNNNHMTSRQSKTVHPRPEMTSRDVQRVASRGVDRAVPSPRSATATQGWICDDERVRLMLGANVVDRDSVLAGYQCSTVRSSRPTTAATAFSLPREVSYDRGQDRAAGSTARSRLFSPAPYQFHESSYSAPADCTALRKPHPYVPSARLPCRSGVRAAIVSERTKYHLTSTTRRPTVTSSSGKDGQSSRSSSESQQGASLWVGVAQIVDVRPVSAKAITATVDHDSSGRCYECSGVLSTDDTCCVALGRLYHRHCFNCFICKRGLQGRKFYCINQQLHCEDDCNYTGCMLFADICFVCGLVIRDQVLQAMGNSYHVDCFRCNACRQPLRQQQFTFDVQLRPHCISDYVRIYAPKCDVCHEAIIPSQGSSDVKRLVIADKNYHERCVCCQDCGTSLADVIDEHLYPHLHRNQQQQPQQSACYAVNDRLLCLQCHLRRLSPPTTAATTAVSNTSSNSNRCASSTSWDGLHDNVTWPPVGGTYRGGQSSLFVDVTIDGDASSCTTSDDVTTSDEVISNPGSDVTEPPQQAANQQAPVPAGDNSVWSVDSGHCSGASDVTSDVTVTSSSDTETLDAGSEEEKDDSEDEGDNESRVTSETLVASCDSISILDLLADSSRVTDL